MADEEREEVTEEAAGGGKGMLPLLIIVAAVVVVLLGAVIALLIFAPGVVPFGGEKPAAETDSSVQESAAKEKAQEEAETLGILYSMPPFIVNLVDTTVQRYLKLKVELELNNKEVQAEIDLRMPQIKDSLLVLLSSKTFADIKTVEGKMRLRMEIIGRINNFLTSGRVKNVYFTEFVVQ